MSIIEPGAAPTSAAGMGVRIKGLLTTSTEEWKRIEPEAATTQGVYTGWLIPLALIPAVASVVGMTVFGVGVPGLLSVKIPLLTALLMGALSFAAVLGMTYVMALVINGLAPNFGGTQSPIQALKVATYSATAVLIAGVVQIIPALGFLALVGLIFSIFLMHSGLPVLMKSPPEKTFGYTLSVTGVMFVLWLVAWLALSTVTAPLMGAAALGASGSDRGSVKIGDTTVDIGALEKAAKQMEAQSAAIAAGGVTAGGAPVAAVDPEALKGLLPETLPGGFTRTEISTGSGAAVGMGVASADAKYASGDRTMNVSVVDVGAMGAIAGLAGAFGVQGSTENADGFERTRTVDGRMIMEKVSNVNRSASYGVMVSNRFMLTAEGSKVSLDDAKAAANAVGVARLEALAK